MSEFRIWIFSVGQLILTPAGVMVFENFISQKKMDYARYYILNSNMSVADIAQNSGFVNVNVFSVFFKRNAGVSPLYFRKNSRA